jgi:hypothetical protein
VKDQFRRSARLRYTATGALAALAAAGAIAATGAFASDSPPKSPAPGSTQASQPGPNPFVSAVERLVDNGTITATEGQAVDSQIQAGGLNTDALASSGVLTQAQAQAVQQALSDVKRSLAHP